MAQDTFTRRVMVRGEEKTVTLKVKDLDEPKRAKREAREKARAEARARQGGQQVTTRVSRSDGESPAT